tara:strand:- start:104 stop:466 length:363 start_codon:yes stop_codon:yes gene_type:complete
VTRFGKKVGIFEGRLIFIKIILKKLLYKINLSKTTYYKETISVDKILERFNLSKNLIEQIKEHENNLKYDKPEYSSGVKKIINSEKIHSQFKLKKILLEMYKKEDDFLKKQEIKNEFYSF